MGRSGLRLPAGFAVCTGYLAVPPSPRLTLRGFAKPIGDEACMPACMYADISTLPCQHARARGRCSGVVGPASGLTGTCPSPHLSGKDLRQGSPSAYIKSGFQEEGTFCCQTPRISPLSASHSSILSRYRGALESHEAHARLPERSYGQKLIPSGVKPKQHGQPASRQR